MNNDPRCIACGAPCGLQMLCAQCSAEYRRGELAKIGTLMEHRLREEAKAHGRHREIVEMLGISAIMALLWWFLCVIWLGSAP